MSLMDGLLLTLINTVACIALPKLLSVITAPKAKAKATVVSTQTKIAANKTGSEVPSLS